MTKEKETKVTKAADKLKVVEKTEKMQMTLSCALKPEELEKKGQELAETVSEIGVVEREKSASAKVFSGKLEELDNKLTDLSAIVKNRAEDRTVECHKIFDWKTYKVRVVRLDTGEQVNIRDMSDYERTMSRDLFEKVEPSEESSSAAD